MDVMSVRGFEELIGGRGGGTYQGTPSFNVFWIAVRYANTPRMTAEETSIMKIQKLSWASGQWYFRRR